MENRSDLSVLLVGFQDQDNLGLRYLLSSVLAAGYSGRIVTYQSDPTSLVDIAMRERPDVIGFSLIFQYMAPDFASVIAALRSSGVPSHITMGGHYPSFDYDEVLRKIPGLDSVVRFEGECTLVELMKELAVDGEWQTIPGLAFRTGSDTTANPLRPAELDLDRLPRPYRDDLDYLNQEMPTASVLGSRGCPWDCSFCSIRRFYEAQEGPLRRLRRPETVVEEMWNIHERWKVPVFLFQDDDFLAGGLRARQWAERIGDLLAASRLSGRAAFKISCRSDEIRPDTMRRLMRGGLTHVYMGVESGDPQSLINMSKRIKPEVHLQAGRILRELGLSFDFGFMLLEPDSTLATVRNNVDFLEDFVGDGWSVASFCRMLPYSGTPIKAKLEAEGRLLGTPFEPDYDFKDPKLDLFYEWMLATFHRRNFTSQGLCHILKSLLFEAHLRLPGGPRFSETERAYAHYLVARCNGLAIYTLRSALDHINSTPLESLQRDKSFLERLRSHESESEDNLLTQVVEFYWTVRENRNYREHAPPTPIGGFDKAWTLSGPEEVVLG